MTPTGNDELDALLAAAGAAPFAQDERRLDTVLAAFNAIGGGAADGGTVASGTADVGRRAGRRSSVARPNWLTGRLAAKCAVVILVFTGGGVAMASAGVLPRPVQQFAHNVLGRVGVPAPRKSRTAPSSTPGASATAIPSVSPSASPDAATTSLTALCEEVAQTNGNQWRKVLSAADQKRLLAAAGSKKNVVLYCADLLSGAASATTAPASGTTSATASVAATPSHGKGHVKHTPKPKPKGQ